MRYYYEIYFNPTRQVYQIWQYDRFNGSAKVIKQLKTKKAAENWAKKQWADVKWS